METILAIIVFVCLAAGTIVAYRATERAASERAQRRPSEPADSGPNGI